MKTSYEVRLWKRRKYVGKTRTTHYVRWAVAKQEFQKGFSSAGLAKSFESKLNSAMAEGVAFDVACGLPVTMLKAEESKIGWFEFARDYLAMKWPDASPGHRKSLVDSLTPITIWMLKPQPSERDQKAVRAALRRGLNPSWRDEEHPAETTRRLRWVQDNSRQVAELSEPDVLRRLLAALDLKLDGARAAADTIRLRRTTLGNALDYAVETKVLAENPLTEVRVKKHRTRMQQVDRRSVVNPTQARQLLGAVGEVNERLQAFFALMYFAALRPEEAANLRKHNLSLPRSGWGELFLEQSAPEIGAEWTDSRIRSEQRSLKHREDGSGRQVPCPPELTQYLHDHLDKFGTAADGRLFRGRRNGGRISSTVYGRAWAKARETALTPEQAHSPLGKRPYDLRHAAVSTWLNGGVEPTRVAEWAGHSVGVLLRVYAKCLDGGEQAARQRVEQALAQA
ncbi:tyrosine-type recombinase/integrase [Saccharopolyspora sp. ID03-671]|uniref:tyrosine-type recombinase/integrase n=1 Tax=Saccharopolyspora sp. ID03-671 TaxID=3073066 RepID=UPI00324AEE5C